MLGRFLNKSASVFWHFIYHTLQKRFRSLPLAQYLKPLQYEDVIFDFSQRYLRFQNLQGDIAAITRAVNDRLFGPDSPNRVFVNVCCVSAAHWHFPWRIIIDHVVLDVSLTPTCPELVLLTPAARPVPQSPSSVASSPPQPTKYESPPPMTSAALSETMGVISQMVQTAVDHSSVTINCTHINLRLPNDEETIALIVERAVLHTSHPTTEGEETLDAHLHIGSIQVQNSRGASLLHCGRPDVPLRVEVSWKTSGESNAIIEIPDTFVHFPQKLLEATRILRDLPSPAPEADVASSETPQTPSTPTEAEAPRSWLGSLLMRLSGLRPAPDESSPFTESPGIDSDYIAMQSCFAMDQTDVDGLLLTVDKEEKQVLTKLLQSADDVKTYLLEELRKEEKEGNENKTLATLLRPALILKDLFGGPGLENRREALMKLSPTTSAIQISLQTFTFLLDLENSAEVRVMDGGPIANPVGRGQCLECQLQAVCLRSGTASVSLEVGEISTHLIKTSLSRSLTQHIVSSVQIDSCQLDHWGGDVIPIPPGADVYSELCHRSNESASFLTCKLECPPLDENEVCVSGSLHSVTIFLTPDVLKTFRLMQALIPVAPFASVPAPPSTPANRESALYSRKSDLHSLGSAELITSSEPSTTISARAFAECVRVVVLANSPGDAQIIGLVSVENVSAHYSPAMSFATDILVGLGKAHPCHQQLKLAPLVLTKDPLWFSFGPKVYFEEHSQVFQLTDSPERPPVTPTLVDTPMPSIEIEWNPEAARETSSFNGSSPTTSRSSFLNWKPKIQEPKFVEHTPFQNDTAGRLDIRVLALIFSWPRGYVNDLFASIDWFAPEEVRTPEEVRVPDQGLSPDDDTPSEYFKPTPSHQEERSSIATTLISSRISVSLGKLIAHYIPRQAASIAVATTLDNVKLSVERDQQAVKCATAIDDFAVSIFLFNQHSLQWVQHRSCLTKRRATKPAVRVGVLFTSHTQTFKVDLHECTLDLNESLLILLILLIREEERCAEVVPSTPTVTATLDELEAAPSRQEGETPKAKSQWPSWLPELHTDMPMCAVTVVMHNVSVTLMSDLVTSTLPATLELLRTGDIMASPIMAPLLWGYELRVLHSAVQCELSGFQITRLKEAVLDVSLLLRETATISLKEVESNVAYKRLGLFTIADYEDPELGEQLSSPIQLVRVCNFDLAFLEPRLIQTARRQPERLRIEQIHVSLASSTIATVSASLAQVKEFLNLSVDGKRSVLDVALMPWRVEEAVTVPANDTLEFLTPGVVMPTACRSVDTDSEWEVDEYYNELVAELGEERLPGGWRDNTVVAAKPAAPPTWTVDMQLEIRTFTLDLKPISIGDLCVASVNAERVSFILSSVTERATSYVPLRRLTFISETFCIRDMTAQSHFEFVCQPYKPSRQPAITLEVTAYEFLNNSSTPSFIAPSSEYTLVQSEPSSSVPSCASMRHANAKLVEHFVNVSLAPLWITLDMKTLTAFSDFVDSLEALQHLTASSKPSSNTIDSSTETALDAVSALAFLADGLWNTADTDTDHLSIKSSVMFSPNPSHHQFSAQPHEEHGNHPLLIRMFESREILIRFDFHSEGLDPQRLRQGGLIAALNFLAQLCSIEGLEIPFKRVKLEGLMTPKELMVRILAASVADFDRSQVLRYAMRGTPILRSIWDISTSLKTLMSEALAQPSSSHAGMELATLRRLREVFDCAEWCPTDMPTDRTPSEMPATSEETPETPGHADFTDALETFEAHERTEFILELTRRSFLWVEDQAFMSLKSLAGQASGTLPFAVKLAEHSGDFLKCLVVESLKISERLMSSCSRRIAAFDMSVSQHLCLREVRKRRPISLTQPPTHITSQDSESPKWSFVEKGASGFYEPMTAREGLQDAAVHLRRGWDQAFSIAEQLEVRRPWTGGDIMADNRAMMVSVVSLEALQAVGRVLPVLLLKPVVTLTEALTSALQGTRNQIDPQQRAERSRSLRAPKVSGEELVP
eukprot:Blabericola_migrator_1__12832@NODE_82_length_14933_cov_91_583546_g73_i0_p1_GENE_NODE_82_length_14933_cov_91_583546_g73_i0NODE_82_length_14933_cov_91_583546_g73_i0_p1_ORF_typecomplete_len1990_score335_93ATG_C/PF09333_11/2_4e11VPS13_mid_rpt/PF16910_5/7_6e03VPS13_mid_rpt/PF16910_5/0_18_NODE_82_length_14933_cov_91_583546_g73_i0743313402